MARCKTVFWGSDVLNQRTGGWLVRNRETCADTRLSENWEDYYALKRVWRRSKEDFDSACRHMGFNDLFSTAGVKL
jgi:hypothetical protein